MEMMFDFVSPLRCCIIGEKTAEVFEGLQGAQGLYYHWLCHGGYDTGIVSLSTKQLKRLGMDFNGVF